MLSVRTSGLPSPEHADSGCCDDVVAFCKSSTGLNVDCATEAVDDVVCGEEDTPTLGDDTVEVAELLCTEACVVVCSKCEVGFCVSDDVKSVFVD